MEHHGKEKHRYRPHELQGNRPLPSGSRATRVLRRCGDPHCSASHRRKRESDADFQDRRKLQARLCRIQRKIIVVSGKGGVGKSTVVVNLVVSLAQHGSRVGLLDVDIHGPSIPTMLGLEQASPGGENGQMLPVEAGGLKVMSLGFFLRHPDEAVIWRGPLKMTAIKQFLRDVVWGDLDFLVVDSPPGTGDEPLSVCQLLGRVDGAVIVTTPQRVAAVDVRKSISFCRELRVPVIGVLENMSGFVCPRCGELTPILRSGGGRRIALDMGVPFLGAVPIDPDIAACCDEGRPFLQAFGRSQTARIMREAIRPVEALAGKAGPGGSAKQTVK
jgi:Mrp family chromosome partitioning ATPase